MKICLMHIVDSAEQFGGAEKVVLMLAERFAADRDIEVAAAINGGWLFDGIASIKGVKVYLLPDKRVLSLPRFYAALYRIVRDFNPDIVHSHHRHTTFLTHLLPFRNYELIHTFHLEQFTKKWNRFFGDYATAVSKACKEHFVRNFNLKDEFITVIYNGVDANLENIAELPIERRNKIIASVIGRLTEQKGHSVLLKAISILPASVKENLKVIFVGDGEKRKELERMVIEHDLKDWIEFVGYQKNVYPYIMASDFTILPSLWEGFGLSIVESYFCGKPVIGSNVGGIPELIMDQETGLLVPPNNYQALSNAILHFVNNRDLIRRYGEAGKKLAMEKFTVGKMIENYKAIYKKVLKENNEN